jgi:hypothetical protein
MLSQASIETTRSRIHRKIVQSAIAKLGTLSKSRRFLVTKIPSLAIAIAAMRKS